GLVGIDAVGLHAGRRVFQHAVGIAPQPVLLELVLELDAERAGEYREVVLDRDASLGLEAARRPLAAVIDARQRVGAGGARPLDLVAHQAVPDLLAERDGDRRCAGAAEARLRRERNQAEARHGGEQLAARARLPLARLAHGVGVQ